MKNCWKLLILSLCCICCGCGSTFDLYQDKDVCDCGHTREQHNHDPESQHECLFGEWVQLEGMFVKQKCWCTDFYAVEIHDWSLF